MRIAVLCLVLGAAGCNLPEPPNLPAHGLAKAGTVAEAKRIAQTIASQSCIYRGYDSMGDDIGAQNISCPSGHYGLVVSQTHVFEWSFRGEVGETFRLRYSDSYLMKPEFLKGGNDQKTNPAYYLMPLVILPRIEPPPPPMPTFPPTPMPDRPTAPVKAMSPKSTVA